MSKDNVMKISVSAFAWTRSFTEAHIPLVAQVAELGFAGLEIPMFSPADLPLLALRRAFDTAGIAGTVCAILPPGINPTSPDRVVRQQSLSHLKACVEATAEMGMHLIGGPVFAPIGYLPGHRPTAEEWQWGIEAFASLVPSLEQCGITLSIEPVNRAETFYIRTAQEAHVFCEAIGSPRIGVTIDTFHANIEEKSIPAAVDLLGPALKHMHLSENDRGILGSGHIDFGEISRALERNAFDSLLVIEGFGFSAAEPDAPGYLWADKEVSPENLALKSLAFLKSLAR